jgi:hypothetical protein
VVVLGRFDLFAIGSEHLDLTLAAARARAAEAGEEFLEVKHLRCVLE